MFAVHKEGVRCQVLIVHVITSPLPCSDFFVLCWPCICCNMFSITFLLAAIIMCRLCRLYICCNMPSITFLLVANSPPVDRGNNSMGHAWLLAGLTMKMEQHKVQRIVSMVQVIGSSLPPVQEHQHLCQWMKNIASSEWWRRTNSTTVHVAEKPHLATTQPLRGR